MKNEAIPVKPGLITWARERAGYSIEEAGAIFGSIADWEAETESYPTYPQLERMSAQFGVPVAVFFFPEPPEMPDVEQSFRTLSTDFIQSLPRNIKKVLRKAQAMQINLHELYEGKNPASSFLISDLEASPDTDASSIASKVRNTLDVTINAQMSWPDPESALENWRTIFESRGIFVFKDAFKQDGFSGFCLYDEVFPIIYINNSTTKTRQIFTLFHELAHLIFSTSGIDKNVDDYIEGLEGDSKKIEVLCNKFAADFLLPEKTLNEMIEERGVSPESASYLAAQLNISREVVYRKFLDGGNIDKKEYEERTSEWNSQKKKSSSGGNYYYTQFSYLGEKYIETALKNYNTNKIDENELSEYLNIKPKSVSKFEELFARRAL